MGDREGFSSCTRPRLLRLNLRILDSCSAPSRKFWKGVAAEAGTGASTEMSIRHAKKIISLNTHQSFLRIQSYLCSQPASESSLQPSAECLNDFGLYPCSTMSLFRNFLKRHGCVTLCAEGGVRTYLGVCSRVSSRTE